MMFDEIYESTLSNAYAMVARAEASRGNDPKVFDWKKAREIINDNPSHEYSAGLEEDWSCTGGTIWKDEFTVNESYCYLMSTWATPILWDDTTGDQIECWRYMSELRAENIDWGSDTMWPDDV